MQFLSAASFAILDAATMGAEFKTAASRQPLHTCLFRGESEQNLATVAPYLFPLTDAATFGKWLLDTGWGRGWGVRIVTAASNESLRVHLRKFLIVKTEDGKELYFRYYDPRVLRVILPSFKSTELKELFGPIEEWVVEDEDARYALRFRLVGQELRTLREPLF